MQFLKEAANERGANIRILTPADDMNGVRSKYSNCDEPSIVEKVIITFVLPIVVLVLIATQFALAQTNQTTTWTKYTDPQGRFSINHLVNWTAARATNRFQDLLVQFNNTHYTGLTIDLLPTNVTDPTVFANAYKVNHSIIPSGFSIFQNVECVKYQIDGQKVCSVLITATKPNGTKLEGEQVFSYVNGKMFVISMVGKKTNFEGYQPTFRNMLTSFRSPPEHF